MEIKKYIVDEDTSIIDTMKVINDGARTIAFVCKDDKLVAVVTDGDIRRHIIKNGDMTCMIKEIANYNPIFVYRDDNYDAANILYNFSIQALPIVDREKRIVDIIFTRNSEINYEVEEKLNVPLVIMAGGKGTRLLPYTQILPKPLIPIGRYTISEHIIKRFQKFDCTNVTMIVNYKKDFIKSYFKEEGKDIQISFIDENEYLGTAGGLKLLKGRYNESFFMSNCDVLINANYGDLYRLHCAQKNIITLVCAKKTLTVPYGTVNVSKEGNVTDFIEKPQYEFLTNTGLYVINTEFIDMIPDNTFIHITDVIKKCIDENKRVGVYLIDEKNWMDMGQIEELEKMKEKMEID